ncbi:uncharacterized protein V6R79_002802 [Siganus canaliculatus]
MRHTAEPQSLAPALSVWPCSLRSCLNMRSDLGARCQRFPECFRGKRLPQRLISYMDEREDHQSSVYRADKLQEEQKRSAKHQHKLDFL